MSLDVREMQPTSENKILLEVTPGPETGVN